METSEEHPALPGGGYLRQNGIKGADVAPRTPTLSRAVHPWALCKPFAVFPTYSVDNICWCPALYEALC